MNENASKNAFEKALKYFPGGVNSPVRAFKNVDSTPFFVSHGEGAELVDVDGNRYIDYVQSWGPLILGHAHPEVKQRIEASLSKGWTYGAPTNAESELAEKVKSFVPSMEKMRFVNSGTEAAMGAIRLARGKTGRDLIVKTDGGYHGHSDALLVSAGSGLATLGTSSSAGVPESFAASTIVIPVNNAEALEEAFKNYQDRIAAFILEPVSGNIGVIPPKDGYLQRCRELCDQNGACLIFDEVMCGFRVSKGGAQERYQVHPDITVLGKVIGGGFPVGAYGASAELMDLIAPSGPVYQAGTLSGNPVAMTAGLATLDLLDKEFDQAIANADKFVAGLHEIAKEISMPSCINQAGTMFSFFLCEGPVENFQSLDKLDKAFFAKFHRALLESGVYFAPSPYEACFMSSAHTSSQIEHTLESIRDHLRRLA